MDKHANPDIADGAFVHPSAIIELKSSVGERTRVWGAAWIGRQSTVGADCTIGRCVHVEGSQVGDRCSLQTFAYLCPGTRLEDEVFVGPHVCFTNHRRPTAVRDGEFIPEGSTVKRGARIGANATIGPGITIGEGAFVQMGARVFRDVPAGATVYGSPDFCVQREGET